MWHTNNGDRTLAGAEAREERGNGGEGRSIYYLRLTIYYLWRSEDGGLGFA